jgi:drug/metabolite transporter (DMT)-like permease
LGLTANLAKLATGAGLNPLSFLAWSVIGAAVLLTGVKALTGRLPALTRRRMEYFFVAALVSVAAPNLLFFAAVPHVGAGFVAISIAFPPLYTYAGALALGMERFNTWRALGVVLALAGAALLAIYKFSAPDAATIWILAALIAPVILAVGNLYRTLRWPDGAKPDELAPGMLAAAGVLLLAAVAIPGLTLEVPLDRKEPALLIAVQALAFAGQYFLFFILQKRGGPVYLSLLGSVAAVVGVPIAVLLLGEAVPEGLAAAAALIAAGIYLVSRRVAAP